MANRVGFAICSGKGFHITFKNDVTVSVQFGVASYSEHHDDDLSMIGKEKEHRHWESIDAEVAMWDKEGTWITKEYFKDDCDDVYGWVTPDELPELLAWAANYTSD